jgi:hypothetical protein
MTCSNSNNTSLLMPLAAQLPKESLACVQRLRSQAQQAYWLPLWLLGHLADGHNHGCWQDDSLPQNWELALCISSDLSHAFRDFVNFVQALCCLPCCSACGHVGT